MSVGDPIRLGSAAVSRLIFQTGSTITVSASGIQQCDIKALCPDGANVFNYIPAAGASYNTVFGNGYLPADFKVDRSKDSSVKITYEKGTTAEIELTFKRADPNKTGFESRKIALDSIFKPVNPIFFGFASDIPTGSQPLGQSSVPEPAVTVTYNANGMPPIGGELFALPGSTLANGFPTVANTTVNCDLFSMDLLGNGSVCRIAADFVPSPLGWQRIELKADPQTDGSLFDVTETWRMAFIWHGSHLVALKYFTDFNIPSITSATVSDPFVP